MNEQEIISKLSSRLEEQVTSLTFPIQRDGDVNDAEFAKFQATVVELLVACKTVKVLPKAVLNAIYFTINLLRNEAPHLKNGPAKATAMSNKLEHLFGLLLIGETVEERKPGVPRII